MYNIALLAIGIIVLREHTEQQLRYDRRGRHTLMFLVVVAVALSNSNAVSS